jgi:hypothetical protein
MNPSPFAAADACCNGSLARKERSLGAGYRQNRYAAQAGSGPADLRDVPESLWEFSL